MLFKPINEKLYSDEILLGNAFKQLSLIGKVAFHKNYNNWSPNHGTITP
jgi:hypothetical protein